MIDEAIAFAAIAHAEQKRKYDNLPYIVHPIEVMTILSTYAVDPVTEEMLVAAVLHDVVEDTPVGLSTIQRRFGDVVAKLVEELTDVYVDPSQGNRKQRKEKERRRLATVSRQAQSIKYADLISNTRSIVKHDKSFAVVYVREKDRLLDVMVNGDPALFLFAQDVLQEAELILMRGVLR